MSAKVLVIEDDSVLGTVLLDKLTAEGYEATLVVDGKEGLAAISSKKPDLVLLDILLPSMNGYEILEVKHKDPAIKDIPVIIVSNSGQPVELQRTLELGAKDYFIKAQFNPDEVMEKVRALVPASGDKNMIGGLQGKKVLLVEDNSLLADVMHRKLSTEGCTLLHAITGEDAVQIVDKEIPDIVLLDLVLPNMSGFDVLKHIKETPATSRIPVVIISNLSQKEDMDRANTLGATSFMVKAMSTPDEILVAVKTILQGEKK